MPKVEIELPTGELDAASRRRIAELEKDLKNALIREDKWRRKVKEQEADKESVKRVSKLAREFIEEIAEEDCVYDVIPRDWA